MSVFSKLPVWAWVLIVVTSLAGLLLMVILLIFLWPWVVATT